MTARAEFLKVKIHDGTNLAAVLAGEPSGTENRLAVANLPIPSTLCVTGTAAAGTGVTITLAAGGANVWHYITRLVIQRYAAAALTAAATPLVITTTNLNGSLAFSSPADAAAQGVLHEQVIDLAGNAMRSSANNTSTTIVAPATTNVIWRLTAYYYTGKA